MRGDLHMHSTCSDGTLTVEQLIEKIKTKKLDVVCKTDHDTLLGSDEFVRIARENGLISYPALELSTYSNGESVHVLAFFKSTDTITEEFKEYLVQMKQVRYDRMRAMTENMNKLYNLDIDFEKIAKLHPNMLERPHLAQELVEKLGITTREAFKKYIGDDCPGYIPSTKIPTKDGIDMIHKAGGLAILAHPYQYKKNDPIDLINLGVDGVEVFYFPTPVKNYKKYKKYCTTHNLLMSGGSDFHRPIDYSHSEIGSGDFQGIHLENLIKRIEEL